MAKIVGIKDVRELKSKKSGQMMNAYMVFYLMPGTQQSGVVGQEAAMQFVDADLFAAAVGTRPVKELIGKDCNFTYDRRGFLSAFALA